MVSCWFLNSLSISNAIVGYKVFRENEFGMPNAKHRKYAHNHWVGKWVWYACRKHCNHWYAQCQALNISESFLGSTRKYLETSSNYKSSYSAMSSKTYSLSYKMYSPGWTRQEGGKGQLVKKGVDGWSGGKSKGHFCILIHFVLM